MVYVIPQSIESDRLIRRTFIDRLEDISLIPAENESSIKLALASIPSKINILFKITPYC